SLMWVLVLDPNQPPYHHPENWPNSFGIVLSGSVTKISGRSGRSGLKAYIRVWAPSPMNMTKTKVARPRRRMTFPFYSRADEVKRLYRMGGGLLPFADQYS